MIVIIDFDYTLFSTVKFYLAIKKSFKKIGVKECLFKETFEKSKGKGMNYKPEKQIKLIVKSFPQVKENLLKKELKRTLRKASKFLYPDTKPFLKKWQNKADLILLSYGENRFQKEKIRNAKISSYFKKILITKDFSKVSALKRILKSKKDQKVIFVEDNPYALKETKKIFPNLITIKINRKEKKYATAANNPKIDFSIKNLKELEKILIKIIKSNF